MRRLMKVFALCVCGMLFAGVCLAQPRRGTNPKVKIETTKGNIVVELFNSTPLHRDNFLKLVKAGTLDGTLFHRVINQFMIQGGDPSSKTAKPGQKLGEGDLGYTVPAEIRTPRLFNVRGALAAAREGDKVNPSRASSASQFYIVTGKKYTADALRNMEYKRNKKRIDCITDSLMRLYGNNKFVMNHKADTMEILTLERKVQIVKDDILAREHAFHFTPRQIRAYTSQGGAPHLDGAYTVFGRVVEGMNVVDAIQQLPTDKNDRPTEDVRIIKMSLLGDDKK